MDDSNIILATKWLTCRLFDFHQLMPISNILLSIINDNTNL